MSSPKVGGSDGFSKEIKLPDVKKPELTIDVEGSSKTVKVSKKSPQPAAEGKVTRSWLCCFPWRRSNVQQLKERESEVSRSSIPSGAATPSQRKQINQFGKHFTTNKESNKQVFEELCSSINQMAPTEKSQLLTLIDSDPPDFSEMFKHDVGRKIIELFFNSSAIDHIQFEYLEEYDTYEKATPTEKEGLRENMKLKYLSENNPAYNSNDSTWEIAGTKVGDRMLADKALKKTGLIDIAYDGVKIAIYDGARQGGWQNFKVEIFKVLNA